ncbi:ABC transporter permease [Desulfitobacterium sp. Sab5]|uniref:ABC transporter permease n=1 Tax=Desulfitobacterium nosdiversum TaxID=3375356 RepID=UPI003CF84678
MFFLAWKNVTQRKGQTIITLLITVLTVATFVLAHSLFTDLQEGMRLSATRLGADIIVLPHSVKSEAFQTIFTGEPVNEYMPDNVLESVRSVKDVQLTTPQFFTQTLDESCCSLSRPYRVVGYDPGTDFVTRSLLNSPNGSASPANDKVILGANVTSFLGGKAVILGKEFYEAGRLERTGTGIDDTIFIRLDTARTIAKNSPYLQNLWQKNSPDHLISSILIKVKDGASPAVVADEINGLNLGVNAVATSKVISSARNQMNTVSHVLIWLWLALALTAALALIGRFTALARERKRELGMLRAIGGQSGDAFAALTIEALLIVGAGGLTGSIAGALLTNPILTWLRGSLNLPQGDWSLASAIYQGLWGMGIAVFLGAVSALYPAWRSSKLDPQEIISHGELD